MRKILNNIPCSCSVLCGRAHKDVHSNEPNNENATTPTTTTTTALNTLSVATTNPNSAAHDRPPHRFDVVTRDPRLPLLFAKYPELDEQLALLDRAYRPPPFEERLRTGWTTEFGRERGIRALREARARHECVQEYSDLVLLILAEQAERQELAQALSTTVSTAERMEIRRLMALDGQ